jgi:hypothetical protein
MSISYVIVIYLTDAENSVIQAECLCLSRTEFASGDHQCLFLLLKLHHGPSYITMDLKKCDSCTVWFELLELH